MKTIIRLLLSFCTIKSIWSNRVVSWYVNNFREDPRFPIKNLNWSIYTHLKSGDPLVLPNGTALCNSKDMVTPKLVKIAHQNNVKIQWGLGFNINPAKPNTTFINNYLNTIKHALNQCQIDGIEVDYEWHNNLEGKIGIILPKLSNTYSNFLKDLKSVLGKDKIVSADISIWGLPPNDYILGIFPWVNVTMLNNGDFDFVNTMSYYWPRDKSLWKWKKDMYVIKHLWKMDPKRVNIGLPYFSMNRSGFKDYNQPTWSDLSSRCPNINSELDICDKVYFIGKNLNYQLGQLIKKEGFGGAFPWASNYDSIRYNNTLINWLYRGLNS